MQLFGLGSRSDIKKTVGRCAHTDYGNTKTPAPEQGTWHCRNKAQGMEHNWEAEEIILFASRWHRALLKRVPANSRMEMAHKRGDSTEKKKLLPA